jgi:hypothetical protein
VGDRHPKGRDAGFEVVLEAGDGAWQFALGVLDQTFRQLARNGAGRRLVGGGDARLELGPEVFRHLGRQVAHPVRQTALALGAREAGLDRLNDAGAPSEMTRSGMLADHQLRPPVRRGQSALNHVAKGLAGAHRSRYSRPHGVPPWLAGANRHGFAIPQAEGCLAGPDRQYRADCRSGAIRPSFSPGWIPAGESRVSALAIRLTRQVCSGDA